MSQDGAVLMQLAKGEAGGILRSQEEWLQGVFQGSAIGIAVVDLEGRFTEVNAAFRRMVGFEEEELRGQPFTYLNDPEDNARDDELFQMLVEDRLTHYQISKRYRCKDGIVLPVRLTTSIVREPGGQPRFCVAMVEDITEQVRADVARQALEERLRYNALHDPLTGLPNRTLIGERLEAAVEHAAKDSCTCAVLFLDLDGFKLVNDSLGHLVGDDMLRVVAERLRLCTRSEDTVARFGGDEFVVLLQDISGPSQALDIASTIQQALAAPVDLGGYETFTTASIGIALSEPRGVPSDHLLRNADMAMYRAKVSGIGRSVVFDRSMHAAAMEKLQLGTDLRYAMQRGQFHLAFQPIISLATGRITTLEALVRWQHPLQGPIAPDRFIPLAEETGLILPLGNWILGEALRQLALIRAQGPVSRSLQVSVNLSPKQLRDAGLIQEIPRLLEESGLPANCLKLELTESSVLENPAISAILLRQLKELDIQIYLDDFGTGYSSLSYLHQLPLDALKIDRAFIRGLEAPTPQGRANADIVGTIAMLARNLGVRVVAEGVDNRDQVKTLRDLGCDYAQGYLFSTPIPGTSITPELLGRAFC